MDSGVGGPCIGGSTGLTSLSHQLVHQLVHLLVHQVVHLLVHQLPLQHTPVWKRIRFYSNILKIDPDQMLILCHVTFQNHTIHLNQYYQAK